MNVFCHSLSRLTQLLAIAGLLLLLSHCSGNSSSRRQLTVLYDDLGTSAMLQPILGPRGHDPLIVVHHGSTQEGSQPRHLNVHQGMLMLRRNARLLPHTPENQPLRNRMRIAYQRMFDYYRTRRDAFMAVPPFAGRGSMGRQQLMPPMPPTL